MSSLSDTCDRIEAAMPSYNARCPNKPRGNCYQGRNSPSVWYHRVKGKQPVRYCEKCGTQHWRTSGANVCVNCVPRCSDCGRKRYHDHQSGLCSKCDPEIRGKTNAKYERKRRKSAHKEAIKSPARYDRERKTVRQRRIGYTDAERKARLVCKLCYDLPHARPLTGCKKCKRPHGEIRVSNNTSVISSSLGGECRRNV